MTIVHLVPTSAVFYKIYRKENKYIDRCNPIAFMLVPSYNTDFPNLKLLSSVFIGVSNKGNTILLRGKYDVLINVTWDCFDQSNFIDRCNPIAFMLVPSYNTDFPNL
jgi:hypothetical protein